MAPTDADTETDSAGVIAHPPLLYAPTALVGAALDWLIPVPFLAEPLRFTAGPALAVLSGILAVVAILGFRRAGTNVPTNKPTMAIVTSGPYRFSRNPIYVALTGLYLGIAVMLNSLWLIVLLAPLLIVMRLGVIQREEAYLEAKFGAEYTDYKTRVRRWI
jgi:protein-S-isoprenylcysteine O-methyltransferase Ste14